MADAKADERELAGQAASYSVTEPPLGPALSDPFGPRDNDQVLSPASKDDALPDSPDSLKQDATAAGEDRSGHEWDAAKILPSQWGKRKGSVYATPASRDGHVDSSKTRDKSFHDKLKEKGWLK